MTPEREFCLRKFWSGSSLVGTARGDQASQVGLQIKSRGNMLLEQPMCPTVLGYGKVCRDTCISQPLVEKSQLVDLPVSG